MAKRRIFNELMEGVTAMKAHREGKITLRSDKVKPKPLPRVDSKLKAPYAAGRRRKEESCNQARHPSRWPQGRGERIIE